MTLDIHRPYPGVALAVTEHGSVLLGAPADAFKATKKYCGDHELPFPRVLVAPQDLLVEAAPQFNPEFFLYDFLFVYGAAFKPDLQDERLSLVLDANQVAGAKEALRITLNGPSREELSSIADDKGRQLIDPKVVAMLSAVTENMALKKGDAPRALEDSITTVTFDASGSVDVLDGHLTVQRTGPHSFDLKAGKASSHVDLTIVPPVVPYAILPVPAVPQRPMAFGVKPLGTRNGFDLSGPTTGFVIWVNGRAVIYDGPVGTRYLLESQGISPEDVEIVILSHCHEDHMGAFVELFLAGFKPKVITAEPVWQSALIKLSSYFRRPPQEVAALIDYQRVVPGVPIEELGAIFDFFYTVHSIPTIGVNVRMKDSAGTVHQIQISGDTMHHEGLDRMHGDGVINDAFYHRMRNLVPEKRIDNAYYFADVGEAIIHGHPKDWADNPNHLVYYHCPDNDHTRSFGHELAVPGGERTLIEPPKLHPATPGRLLSALRFLDLNDPGWFQSLLYRGHMRDANPGEVLASPSAGSGRDTFTVVVTGTADVQNEDGELIATLTPGEFFGAIELVDSDGRHSATVVAKTPMELFEMDGAAFFEYVQRKGLQEQLEGIWRRRPLVESARLFRSLDTAARNQVARHAEDARFSKGDVIVAEGSLGDDFYLLLEGEVEILAGRSRITTLKAEQPDNFFGEISAIYPERRRSASVVAVGDVRTLRLRGQALRHLFEQHMGVRYALMVAIADRGG